MKKNIILTAFSLLLLYGCTGDMERIQTGTNTEELIYADAAKTRQILNNLYARTRLTQGSFSSFSGDGVTFLDCATDNAYAPIEYSSAHTHGKSTMSASDIAMNGGHPWTFYYNSIRNATLFIQKVDKSVLSDEEKASSKLQARFLRALYYAELYRWYGGVVLLGDEIISPTDLDRSRSTAEATVDYIVSELADVASQLPLEWDAPNYGRATKGAALAYIARTKLYAASKLNNPSMDRKKWEDARDALSAVMGLNIYDLYYDTQNPELSYAHYFCERKTKENIYTYLLAANATMHSNLPQGAPWNEKSYVGCTPTQNLVDAYWSADGHTVPAAPSIEARATAYDKMVADVKKETAEEGSTPFLTFVAKKTTDGTLTKYDYMKEYRNRDSRMYASILFPFKTWHETNYGAGYAYEWIKGGNNESKTGFNYRKMVALTTDSKDNANAAGDYPCIRYAEILLIYAEAHTQTTGYDQSVRDALNDLRDRCGMPDVPATLTKDEALNLIRRERRVELAGEGFRGDDMTRYEDSYWESEMNNVPISMPDGETVITMKWSSRMRLKPIPQTAITLNPLLENDQNPGY